MSVETRLKIDAEAPILWPHDAKNLLLGKDPDAGKGRQRMRWLDGITDSMEAPGVGDGQGGLACYGPWGHKMSDMID